MELWRLDSNFQPDKIIGQYESLIWSERYSKNGDFQITSSEIAKITKALPVETYVTLRDSTVVMKTEFHKIVKSKTKVPQVVITGRTFDATTLELRASTRDVMLDSGETVNPPKPPWGIAASKSSDAAYQAIRTVIGDTLRYQNGVNVLPIVAPAVSLLDAIPEVELTIPADYAVGAWNADVTFGEGDIVSYTDGQLYRAILSSENKNKIPSAEPTFWEVFNDTSPATTTALDPTLIYDIPFGNLYSTVMALLDSNHRGLKCVRPGIGTNQVAIEIYNGVDRRSQIQFNARFDQIDDATYLVGLAGSTNIAYVYGSNGRTQVNKNSGVGYVEPSGLQRRVLAVDASTDTTANTDDLRKTRGLVELYKNNATALFGGEVAIQIASEYNKSYFLGDILKLVGEYGLSQDVRVAEFIRSQDNSGEKAYPTFEAVE